MDDVATVIARKIPCPFGGSERNIPASLGRSGGPKFGARRCQYRVSCRGSFPNNDLRRLVRDRVREASRILRRSRRPSSSSESPGRRAKKACRQRRVTPPGSGCPRRSRYPGRPAAILNLGLLILFCIQKYTIFNPRPARELRNEIRFIGKDCQTSLHLFHNSVERVEDTVCTEFFPKLVPQNLCRV